MNCLICNSTIPAERLEALPSTKLCIGCAQQRVQKRVGFMDYSHKTAPAIVMIDGGDKQSIRLAQRAFRRAR